MNTLLKTPNKNPFVHRDIDWLSFNARVLQEAKDSNNPLLERLKFLAIFSSNLDEFFKVRVSQLRQVKKVEKELHKKLALKPNKILKQILEIVNKQQQEFGEVYSDIIKALASEGVKLIEDNEFTDEVLKEMKAHYDTYLNTNIIAKTRDELTTSFFQGNQIYTVITFENSDEFVVTTIPVSEQGRFIEFNIGNETVIVFIEDIINRNVSTLFKDKVIQGCYQIKLSRDAELYLDDEYEGNWVDLIYESLSQRMKGQPTRLLFDQNMPKGLQKELRKCLGLGKVDMFPGGKRHNFSDFFTFPIPEKKKHLVNETKIQLKHHVLSEAKNIFDCIEEKDQIVHFPYQSFDSVERFVEEAAVDPQVTRIKISLYRTAKESKLTNALLKAIEQGKKVTIFIEAQARFDEANNLKWGKIFEEKGAKVLYSIRHIKVHSKILLINRKVTNEIKRYAYIGTGNFNAKTAKLYCDHGLFTAHKEITKDLSQVFKVIERKLIIPKLKHLLVSPFSTRSVFENMIRKEIKNAEQGLPAKIMAKMNSLEDKKMIQLLYEASQKGVEIRLLVRGFCCLVPQVKGISDNIVVTSVVDRYLEHGRIYIFHNNGNEKMYIGSADWMTRNLDKRIEVLTPIVDKEIFSELKAILQIQFNDNVKARYINASASNEYVLNDEAKIRSQYAIYDYLNENS